MASDLKEKTQIELAVEGLKQRANQFANIDTEKLLRRDLGVYGFQELAEDINNLKDFSKRVVDCSWNGVPMLFIQNLSNAYPLQLDEPLKQLKIFSPGNTTNVNLDRQNRITNFRDEWSKFYVNFVSHLIFAESVDSGASQFQNKIKNILDGAEDAKNRFQDKMKAIELSFKADQERMKSLVKDIEDMAQIGAVKNQAKHFKVLADQYLVAAGLWFLGSVLAGVTLYWFVKNLNLSTTNDSAVALIEVLAPRLITVTLLSTALIFCIRNFSALMHNVIVNRHRQTALQTFDTFVNSTDDPGTRNAVLMQSTQAIFSPQPSGYLKTDTEMPQMNQVTEIVRGIAAKDK